MYRKSEWKKTVKINEKKYTLITDVEVLRHYSTLPYHKRLSEDWQATIENEFGEVISYAFAATELGAIRKAMGMARQS